jgi:replicative DNA helicase
LSKNKGLKSIKDQPKRIPPQSMEAEQSILGGILIDNQALPRVMEIIEPEDFYKEAHRKIYEAILELFQKNEPTDLITLINALKKKDCLEEVGGVIYLNSLADIVPTAANIDYYANIVREKSLLRKLIQTASEILQEGYEDREDIDTFFDDVERRIFLISEQRIKRSYFPLKEIIKDSFETIEMLYEKKELVTGIASGFKDLDKLTSGFQPSDLIVVAGRPSMGKTAFSLDIARYAAIEGDVPVAIFSLEMSKEQVALRMLCAEAKVDGSLLRTGFLKDTDWPKLTTAAGRLSDAPIFIDDSPAPTILEIRAKARRLKAERGVGLIIVDYLQLVRGTKNAETREQEISEISRSLKALAKELNVPVIALSQLNRRVEDRHDKRPQLADLRESGAIEQDADLIIFIYRDEVYNKSEENRGKAEIIIGKQRNGPIGSINLTFLDKFITFGNYSKIDIY